MNADFVISTMVKEEQYRQGLRKSLTLGSLYLKFIFIIPAVFILAYDFMFFYKYMDLEDIMVILIALVILIWRSVCIITKPKRTVDKAITEFARITGSMDVNARCEFYDNEIFFVNLVTKRTAHYPYGYITRIIDLGDIILLTTNYSRGIYIAKSDISDYTNFMNYLTAKCTSAKIAV